MWSAGETFAIEIGLAKRFSEWREVLREKGYSEPEINYTICDGQIIKFQIFDKFISDPKTKYLEVNCECDSPISVIKDCQKAFDKVFMN